MSKNIWGIVVIVLIVLAVAVGFSFLTTTPGQGLEGFAKCLTSKNVAMYGAYWCTHCQNQKRLFGDAFKFVHYVECTTDTKLCTEKGVAGYPTWIVGDGSKLVGEQSLETLSAATGCALPGPTGK